MCLILCGQRFPENVCIKQFYVNEIISNFQIFFNIKITPKRRNQLVKKINVPLVSVVKFDLSTAWAKCQLTYYTLLTCLN